MIFDPVLDSKVHKEVVHSDAKDHHPWIWYPGQRAAHRHRQKLKASMKRFRYVGYPGSFRQAESLTYFKKDIELANKQTLRWGSVDGRLRMTINGSELDITQREIELTAGKYHILVVVDFTEYLPCFYLESETIATDERWLVSLDRLQWVQAEVAEEPQMGLPLDAVEEQWLIPLRESETLEDGRLLVDFAYYELGQILCLAKGKGVLTITIGQSREEVLEGNKTLLEQHQGQPYQVDGSLWCQSAVQAGRFACFESEGNLILSDICFKAQIWPVTYEGDFRCDDQLLNDCWSMGAATIHSCMHDFYLDAIYRDALPWALDGVCTMEASDLIFGDKRIGRQHLYSQMLPQGASAKDLGTVYLDFQLYTILGIEFDWLARKDRSFLKTNWPVIDQTLMAYGDLANQEGFITAVGLEGSHFFPDWATDDDIGPDCYGTPAYGQILLKHCYDFGQLVANLVGEEAMSAHYSMKSEALGRSIMTAFYNPKKGLFYNGYDRHGQLDTRYTIFAQVFAILYKLLPEEASQVTLESLSNGTVLRHPSISLNWYFELQAYCALGKGEMAVESIKTHIGGILKSGDVRVYEDICRQGNRRLDFYDRIYGKSLCHGVMGAAPVIALSKWLLGIHPVNEPGLIYDFLPVEAGIGTISGRIVTPVGIIEVRLRDGIGTIDLPEGLVLRLGDYRTLKEEGYIDQPGQYQIRRQQ